MPVGLILNTYEARYSSFSKPTGPELPLMAGKPSDQKLTPVKLVRGLLLTTPLTFLIYAVIV